MTYLIIYVVACLVLAATAIWSDHRQNGHTTVTTFVMNTLCSLCPPINLCMIWIVIGDMEIKRKIVKFGEKKLF